MTKRRVTAGRQRYETEHPTITTRIPAEAKARLDAALQAEDLNFSQWVLARLAGASAQTTAAYQRGRTDGRRQGGEEGYQRGRREGERVGGEAGRCAGILAANFAGKHGRSYDSQTVAAHLAARPELLAAAERLIPEDYHRDWNALLRRIQGPRW